MVHMKGAGKLRPGKDGNYILFASESVILLLPHGNTLTHRWITLPE